MNGEQLRARQLGAPGAAAAPAGVGKISDDLRDLLAAQAAERQAMEINHHNETIELRERHVEAVQAFNEKLRLQTEANAKLKAAAAPAPAPESHGHGHGHGHKGKGR